MDNENTVRRFRWRASLTCALFVWLAIAAMLGASFLQGCSTGERAAKDTMSAANWDDLDGRFEVVDTFKTVQGHAFTEIVCDTVTENVYIRQIRGYHRMTTSTMTVMFDGDTPMTKNRYLETKEQYNARTDSDA